MFRSCSSCRILESIPRTARYPRSALTRGLRTKSTPAANASNTLPRQPFLQKKLLRPDYDASNKITATYLCHDPQNAQHHDILERIPPLLPYEQSKNTGPVHVNLLITTGLATWLEESNPFLLNLTKRLLHNLAESSGELTLDLHYSVAIVDRLPGPPSSLLSKDGLSHTNFTQGIGGVYEGFCMDIKTGKLPESAESNVEPHIRWRQSSKAPGVFDAILLPANTLFITGKPTTMFRVTALGAGKKDLTDLNLSERRDLASFKLNARSMEQQFLTVPLTPLTKPRRVTVSMGNVISQIESGQAETDPIPASTELEPAVSSFLAEQGVSSTQVFANIQHVARTSKRLGSDTEERQKTLEPPHDAITGDVHWAESFKVGVLRKVTGGGGGWGKKRGLLSFDPSTNIAEAEDSTNMASLFDDDSDVGSPLKNIAQRGDTVQFFATPPRPSTEAEIETSGHTFGLRQLPPMDHKAVNVVTLGMIPSSSDFKPTPGSVQSTSWTVIPNAFGMLSERGMSIRSSSGSHNVTSKSYRQSTGLHALERRSRLNVPYAALTHIERRPDTSEFELVTTKSSNNSKDEEPCAKTAETSSQPHEEPPKLPHKGRKASTLKPRNVLSSKAEETESEPSKPTVSNSTPKQQKQLPQKKKRSLTFRKLFSDTSVEKPSPRSVAQKRRPKNKPRFRKVMAFDKRPKYDAAVRKTPDPAKLSWDDRMQLVNSAVNLDGGAP